MYATSLVAAPPARTGFHLRYRMLAVVLVGTFMAQFDLYVVNVALPARHSVGPREDEMRCAAPEVTI